MLISRAALATKLNSGEPFTPVPSLHSVQSMMLWANTRLSIIVTIVQLISSLDFTGRQHACENELLLFKCEVSDTNRLTWKSDGYIGSTKNARIWFSADDHVHKVRSNLHATAILNTNNGNSNGLGLRNLSSTLFVEAKSALGSAGTTITCRSQAMRMTKRIQVSGIQSFSHDVFLDQCSCYS